MPKSKHPHHQAHHHSQALPQRPNRFSAPVLVSFMTLLALTGVYIVYQSRAASGTLTLSPASSNVSLGSTFTVTIIENSGSDAVNAVQADLTYDTTKLQFVSINTSTSPFTLQAVNSGGGGTVNISRAAAGTSFTGAQTVATVSFTAIGIGTTPISFANSSALVSATDPPVNVLVSKTGGSYVVADTSAPLVPTGLTAPSRTVTSISLSWAASSDNVGVTSYQVFRNGVQVGTSSTTGFTNTGLTPNTSYNYTVKAVDAAGNVSAASTPLAASTLPDTTKPLAPTGVTAPSKTVTSINLSWNAATDDVAVTGYRILRNGTQVGTSTPTTYTDSGLVPNTSYSYTVIAVDAAGNASVPSTALVTSTLPDTTKPLAPTALTSPTKTSNSISLSWAASTDDVAVTGYRILRNGTQVGTSTATSFVDTGLTQGTAYSYTITAVDAAGNVSLPSAALSVTTISKPGDINGDGSVGILDLSILASNFGLSGRTLSTGDINNDGVCNIFDLSLLALYYGT